MPRHLAPALRRLRSTDMLVLASYEWAHRIDPWRFWPASWMDCRGSSTGAAGTSARPELVSATCECSTCLDSVGHVRVSQNGPDCSPDCSVNPLTVLAQAVARLMDLAEAKRAEFLHATRSVHFNEVPVHANLQLFTPPRTYPTRAHVLSIFGFITIHLTSST
jgi:hypothetical protein